MRPARPQWRTMTWREFLDWSRGKGVVNEYRSPGEPGAVRLVFDDGSLVVVESQHDEDLSDETPGAGIQPPTVRLRQTSP